MPDFVTVSVTNQIKTTNQNLISSPTDLLHSLQTLQTLMLYNHLANPLENNLLFCMSISCSEMDALRPTEIVPGMGIARVPSFKSGMVWDASYLLC